MQAPSYSLIASISSARLSMSRWLVGSSRISSCGPSKVARPISSRAFSPPDSAAILVSARAPEKPICAARPRILASGAPRMRLRDMAIGRAAGFEIVDLMLGEKADVELVGAHHFAAHRREAPADQFGEGRLAVAVGAEQADAIVVGRA